MLMLMGVLGLSTGCQSTVGADREPVQLRVVAYNVEFGRRGTAEQIGEALRAYKPDVVLFNEVPGGDWVQRAGKVLGMSHVHLGEVSSANHKDKYKAVLSRTPLVDTGELVLKGGGWNPASAVYATTRVGGHEVVVYALHVSGAAHGGKPRPGEHQAGDLARQAAAAHPGALVILGGDFNDRLGEPHMAYCLEAGFRSSWEDIGLDMSAESGLNTWNVAGPQRAGVIDHVLYRVPSPMRAVDGGIITLDPVLSDHQPIWTAFEIEPK